MLRKRLLAMALGLMAAVFVLGLVVQLLLPRPLEAKPVAVSQIKARFSPTVSITATPLDVYSWTPAPTTTRRPTATLSLTPRPSSTATATSKPTATATSSPTKMPTRKPQPTAAAVSVAIAKAAAVAVNKPPSRQLDSRLQALGVGLTEAVRKPNEGYWQIEQVIFEDAEEHNNNGLGPDHTILIEALGADGKRVTNLPIKVFWPEGGVLLNTSAKGPSDKWAVDFPMQAAGQAYSIIVADGRPSDSLSGLGLGNVAMRKYAIHVSYYVKFRFVP